MSKRLSPIPASSAAARRRDAFSLIEIMVAMSLLTVIVVGLLATLNQTQRALKASGSQTDALENGRAFLNLLGRELQETVIFPEGMSNAFRFASVSRGPAALVQTVPGSSADRTNQLESFLFTVRDKESNGWKTVFYDFRKGDFDDRGIVSLYRSESRVPYRASLDALPALQKQFLSWNYSAENNTNEFSRMLDGVAHLRFYVYDQNGLLIPQWTQSGSSGYFFTNQPNATTNHFPNTIEVEFGILDSDVLRRIKGYGTLASIQDYLRDRAGNIQVFRQRITIPTGP